MPGAGGRSGLVGLSSLLDLHSHEATTGLRRLWVDDRRGSEGLVVLQRSILQHGTVEDDGEGSDAPGQRTDAEGDVKVLLAV
eukprot:CAMPEP_0197892676 /NCGR_PEP_ID=MMETSP1439-20131203/31229_1 /TAXON_ID=66791 /ORGANISM="Gonyaulax spinifera, Strain CCMP409" /LENGTH=81 /DNA_ID=CAMNT_0043512869 /DNA_START=41 /DNA_END=283 /DNA_ORIENTATION=+